MEIKGIKYVGPIFDKSGYAKANRGNIMALHSLGVPITLAPISFENSSPGNDKESQILKSLIKKDIDYNVVIMHCTPEFYAQLREEGKTNIAYTIWETTKLHPDWPDYINNNVDKVLVGTEWNASVFKESGVHVPIGVVPHGIDMSVFDDIKSYPISGLSDNTFVFYSIFEWQERKNPTALLRAYWHAFSGSDADVALVIKTSGDKNSLIEVIKSLKKQSVYEVYPKIYLITDRLTEDEIHSLHVRGDCYISLDRGEGWGLGPFTAGACGNPIIVTGFGGSLAYAKEDNSYLVDYQLTPVFGMSWSPWYLSTQCWAEPSIMSAVEKMQEVYADRFNNAKAKGQKIKDYIGRHFTWDIIGKKIIKEIEDI